MPRVKRGKLAGKLGIVALGGAAMSAVMGQVPAAAYGPLPPPPATTGYTEVVTSRVVGPAGAVIMTRIDGLKVVVTVPARAFPSPAEVTLVAPFLDGIGNAGEPGYRAIGGVGIEVAINGQPYDGSFSKPFTVDISGPGIRPGDPLVVWAGTSFTPVPATEAGDTMQFTFGGGAKQDFAVLVPLGSCCHLAARARRGGRPGPRGPGREAGHRRAGRLAALARATMLVTPAGTPPAGLGVLSVAWLAARSG